MGTNGVAEDACGHIFIVDSQKEKPPGKRDGRPRREICAGSKLIEEGRQTDSVYPVIDGTFSMRTAALGGREVARLLSGDVMGGIVDHSPASATVQALEQSLVLDIPRRRLNAKLVEACSFAARFYRALSMFLAARPLTTMADLAGDNATDTEAEMDFDSLDSVSMEGALRVGAAPPEVGIGLDGEIALNG